MFKLVLEKAEEPEIKLPTSAGPLKKQESSRKTSISVLPFSFLGDIPNPGTETRSLALQADSLPAEP